MNDNMINAHEAFKDRKYRRALGLYELEISVNPQNLDAYFGAGRSLFMLQRPSDAIDMAEKMISLDSSNVLAHIIKAEAYQRMKETKKSEAEIELAYSIEPTNPIVLLSYGYLLIHKHKWDDAIICLEKAIEQDPAMLYAYLNLGFVYQRKGNKEKTLYCAKKIFELRPTLKNRIRLIYAQLNRRGLLRPIILLVFIALLVSALLHEFVLLSVAVLFLLFIIYFRIIFQTP